MSRHVGTAFVLVLLDAKRGDSADTAPAYAQAYLGKEDSWGVDAMTVNPYLGPESFAPFMIEAVPSIAKNGYGVVRLPSEFVRAIIQ